LPETEPIPCYRRQQGCRLWPSLHGNLERSCYRSRERSSVTVPKKQRRPALLPRSWRGVGEKARLIKSTNTTSSMGRWSTPLASSGHSGLSRSRTPALTAGSRAQRCSSAARSASKSGTAGQHARRWCGGATRRRARRHCLQTTFVRKCSRQTLVGSGGRCSSGRGAWKS
jgi:hypothetical protein